MDRSYEFSPEQKGYGMAQTAARTIPKPCQLEQTEGIMTITGISHCKYANPRDPEQQF